MLYPLVLPPHTKYLVRYPLTLLALLSFFAAAIQTVQSQAPSEKPIRVLIVDDQSPGYYHFGTTATTLRNIIRQDKRFEAVLVEDAEVLGTDLPFDYDVLLLHFKNYKTPQRDATIRANLEKFVMEGGGLFVFHFACGAFEGWGRYEQLAGRIWDPQKRGHDDYRRFTVQIADKTHPITATLADFDVEDELYTCLNDSEVPIHILAEAVSNVDGKTYPMAFVLENGKGRTFHTTLGHDERSLSAAGFQTMIKEALVWCAQRENYAANAEAKALETARDELNARITEITDALPEGVRLLIYLDCGGNGKFGLFDPQGAILDITIAAPENVRFWTFRPDSPIEGVPPQHFTVLYDESQLSFLIEGLDRSKRYQLNVVWWDFDASGRVQSLVVQSPDLSQVRILRPGTALPDYEESGLLAKTVTVPLPMAFVREGKLRLNIRNEGGANAVVNEIWINEIWINEI